MTHITLSYIDSRQTKEVGEKELMYFKCDADFFLIHKTSDGIFGYEVKKLKSKTITLDPVEENELKHKLNQTYKRELYSAFIDFEAAYKSSGSNSRLDLIERVVNDKK